MRWIVLLLMVVRAIEDVGLTLESWLNLRVWETGDGRFPLHPRVFLAAELAADLGRGVTDAGLVEIVDLFRHARFGVFVMDAGGKNLVLAVLGPRLGHDFHFKIRGI